MDSGTVCVSREDLLYTLYPYSSSISRTVLTVLALSGLSTLSTTNNRTVSYSIDSKDVGYALHSCFPSTCVFPYQDTSPDTGFAPTTRGNFYFGCTGVT